MNSPVCILFCLTIALPLVFAEVGPDSTALESKCIELSGHIETLKMAHAKLQDRYRVTIEKRWRQQQEHLRVKEDYKTAIDVLRQQQEILYNELSRVKEESLLRENALQERLDILREKDELNNYIKKQVGEKLTDAAKIVREGFPTVMEGRLTQLADLDGGLSNRQSAADFLNRLLELRLEWLREGAAISIGREVVMPNEAEPVNADICKVGNCFAYAVTSPGDVFLLSSGAKNRQFRFAWKAVTSPPVTTAIVRFFPEWLKNKRISGTMPVDMLQNSTSAELFDGRKRTIHDRFLEYVKAGGPNIIVLWIAGLMALIIIIERTFILLRRSVDAESFVRRFLTFAKDGKTDAAEKMLQTSPSTLARCLHRLWVERRAPRGAAEKVLKEALLKELPPLENRLSLLAAFGAAAPLLGLLGTVGGLITLFQVLNMAGTNDTRVLAGGISEALVNTLTGLAIAIPILLIHGYLSERAVYIQNSTQAASVEVLNVLWPTTGSTNSPAKATDE